MKVIGTFVSRELAAATERELAANRLPGVRWRLEEGGVADDGVVGPAMSAQMPEWEDAGGAAGRQPLTFVVEAGDQEAAWQAASILRHGGATRVELYGQ